MFGVPPQLQGWQSHPSNKAPAPADSAQNVPAVAPYIRLGEQKNIGTWKQKKGDR